MNITLVDIKEKDFEFIKEVYNHYILNTTVTFHTVPVGIEYLKNEIWISHPKYKSYIICNSGNTAGYCYLSQYKKREAYDRSAEITIYLKPSCAGKGIGLQVLKLMEPTAYKNGISVLIGVISGDNERSIKVFEKAGYIKCAHYKKIGEKFGKLLDVVAYQKILAE
ncbi:MAG: N-acetyltransferase family protein [Spirochaetia bacterium]